MTILGLNDRQYYFQSQSVVNASGVSEQSITNFNALGYRIDSIYVSNSDSIDHVITLRRDAGGGRASFGSVNIPAGSGHGGVKALEICALLFPAGIAEELYMLGGHEVYVTLAVIVTAGASLDFFVVGAA